MEKKWNVFTRNIEILVKPSHYVCSIFVIFLSCQCSLLQCVIKAFNKRQCLPVCTNLVHYFSLTNTSQRDQLNLLCHLLTENLPYSLSISIYPMQLFADFSVACGNIRFSPLFAAGDVSRVPPRETSPSAKSEKKRMFSQDNFSGGLNKN